MMSSDSSLDHFVVDVEDRDQHFDDVIKLIDGKSIEIVSPRMKNIQHCCIH